MRLDGRGAAHNKAAADHMFNARPYFFPGFTLIVPCLSRSPAYSNFKFIADDAQRFVHISPDQSYEVSSVVLFRKCCKRSCACPS
jgi:hypothetical protein